MSYKYPLYSTNTLMILVQISAPVFSYLMFLIAL